MSVGEDKIVTVPPEDGYGEYDAERIREYNVKVLGDVVTDEWQSPG